MRIATVRVIHPADPSAYMTINAEDLADGHVLWPEHEADESERREPDPVDAALRVAKGPRGKWYAWRGDVRIPGSYDTEAEAQAAVDAAEAN